LIVAELIGKDTVVGDQNLWGIFCLHPQGWHSLLVGDANISEIYTAPSSWL
jgi:hypothetical protein